MGDLDLEDLYRVLQRLEQKVEYAAGIPKRERNKERVIAVLLVLSAIQASFIWYLIPSLFDARYRAKMEIERWEGKFDSTGRRVQDGQYKWNSDVARNQKDVAQNQIDLVEFLQEVFKANPTLKEPRPVPEAPAQPKFNTPDGSQ